MASVHIPRVRGNRGKTQVQIDRENFEKNQNASIVKAINVNETPVKEKHARIIILGTHHDRSGQLFWHAVQHLQLQGHPILCWKFCHVLHKMLRDGHSQVLVDSRRYTGFMTELGKLWGHLRDSYGNLIANYTKLLIGRLAYYSKVQ
ncbi:Huntingtin-interacting protein 1-related protein [Lamellibrachia satsuma]|nr:Huntingtin-interacting protein 1-related protein [Lamellibrachia satsuma]